MKKITLLSFINIFILLFGMPLADAQQSSKESIFTKNNADSTVVLDQATSEKSAEFFSALSFWNNSNEPKTAAPWHQLASNYLGVQPNEFHLYGYAKIDEKWIPTLFVRRFKMEQKQYEHILLIKGVPKVKPEISGIDIVSFARNPNRQVDSKALRVQNFGFNFEMPVIPSVSRRQKKLDEERAVEIASMQLDFFGFEDNLWLDNKSKQLKNVADTWQVSSHD